MRFFAIATIAPIVMMFVSMYMKPLWRDEYWSLFFSDRSIDFGTLMGDRLRDEVHPPLYYFLLYHWQALAKTVFAQRFLSIVLLGLTAFVVLRLTPQSYKRLACLFLLVCGGSYWVIYFVSEVRPYILLFCLSTLSVFLAWRIVEDGWNSAGKLCAWVLVGGAIGLTHYFGALWFACLGLCLGLSFLKSKDFRGFVCIGVITIIAIMPAAAWISWSLSVLDLTDQVSLKDDASLWNIAHELKFTLNQYFRGLLVKTFGSNPLITFLGFAGLVAALKGKSRINGVLISAVILMTILAFIMHFTVIELIKERAFTPQMPAILFILASGLAASKSHLLKYVPWVTAIMPLFFVTEYFKDREKIDDLQDRISGYSAQCEGQSVVAFHRDMPRADFITFANNKIINFEKNGVKFAVNFINAVEVENYTPTTCPLKAIALVMPKYGGAVEAVQTFSEAGLDVSKLMELKYGKARYIIWIEE